MKTSEKLVRTSMSLDRPTVTAMDILAKRLSISKAEVTRRAIRKLKEESDRETPTMTPIEALEWLQQNGISKEEADKWRTEIEAERKAWKNRWEE